MKDLNVFHEASSATAVFIMSSVYLSRCSVATPTGLTEDGQEKWNHHHHPRPGIPGLQTSALNQGHGPGGRGGFIPVAGKTRQEGDEEADVGGNSIQWREIQVITRKPFVCGRAWTVSGQQ